METWENTDEENEYFEGPKVPEVCIIQREDGEIVFVSLERNPAIQYINNFIHDQYKDRGCLWRQVDTSIINMSNPTVYLMFQNKNIPKENLMLLEFPISQ